MNRLLGAFKSLMRRSLKIGEKFQRRRHWRELSFPILKLPLHSLAGEMFALPNGEVRKLNAAVWQAFFTQLVNRKQFPQQLIHRPTIADDVMNCDPEQV